jgi:hypothetical protein
VAEDLLHALGVGAVADGVGGKRLSQRVNVHVVNLPAGSVAPIDLNAGHLAASPEGAVHARPVGEGGVLRRDENVVAGETPLDLTGKLFGLASP